MAGTLISFHPEMAIFPLGCVLRWFTPAAYHMYASAQTFVRPCPEKKSLIYELET
jgi:hypothetical protein